MMTVKILHMFYLNESNTFFFDNSVPLDDASVTVRNPSSRFNPFDRVPNVTQDNSEELSKWQRFIS